MLYKYYFQTVISNLLFSFSVSSSKMDKYELILNRFPFGFDDVEVLNTSSYYPQITSPIVGLKRKLIELFYKNNKDLITIDQSINPFTSNGQQTKYYGLDLLNESMDKTNFQFSETFLDRYIEFKFDTKNIEYLFKLTIHKYAHRENYYHYEYTGYLSLVKHTRN